MNLKDSDKKFYIRAKDFLRENSPEFITPEIIESYMSLPSPLMSKFTLNDLSLLSG